MEKILELILSLVLSFGFLGGQVAESEPSLQAPVYAEVIAVADGDTITVVMGGANERVRYIGIDTPELSRDGKKAECNAEVAKNRNHSLVSGREVELVFDNELHDRFGRLLAYVYVEDEGQRVFVNEIMVEEGHATTLRIRPNTRHASLFAEKESSARTAGLGLWGRCE